MSLPKKPDSMIMELLIRAKSFQDHAIGHAHSQSSIDRMIAIHNLDNSIEYILRIVIKHLEIEEKTGKNLDTAELASLAGEVNKFLKDNYTIELPYLTEIKLIRQVRNLVQHAMVDPVADLPRHITITQRFFEKILDKIFDLKISEIKKSALIVDQILKEHLKNAETHIDNNRFIEAVISCRDAFENFVLFSSNYSSSKTHLVAALVETQKQFQSLYRYLKQSHFEAELTQLGIETRLYKRFKDYLDHIPHKYCLESHGHIVMQRDWVKDDAAFCYYFVADLIYKWESSKLTPLYQIEIKDKYIRLEFINGIKIEGLPGLGMIYWTEKGLIQNFILTDSDTIKKLRHEIRENNIYEYHAIAYKNGVETHNNKSKVLVTYIDANVVTNNPPRWELTFQYKDVNDNDFRLL